MIDHHGRAMLIDFGIARFLPPERKGNADWLGRLCAARAVSGQARAALGPLCAGSHDAPSADRSRPATRAAVQLSAPASPRPRRFGHHRAGRHERARQGSRQASRSPRARWLTGYPKVGALGSLPDSPAGRHSTRRWQSADRQALGQMATIVLNRPAPPQSVIACADAAGGHPGDRRRGRGDNPAGSSRKTPLFPPSPAVIPLKPRFHRPRKPSDLGLKGKSSASAASSSKPVWSGRSAGEWQRRNEVAAAKSAVRPRCDEFRALAAFGKHARQESGVRRRPDR